MQKRLAVKGGKPVIDRPLPHFQWPPHVPGLSAALAAYVDSAGPLSIPGRNDIYEELR